MPVDAWKGLQQVALPLWDGSGRVLSSSMPYWG